VSARPARSAQAPDEQAAAGACPGSWLFPPPGQSWPAERVRELPPEVLAYVGDALFTLVVRLWALRGRAGTSGGQACGQAWPTLRVRDLHREVAPLTRAGGQARLLETLWPLLSAPEQDLARRARNRRAGRRPRGASAGEYRRSTALEALLGYWLLAGEMARMAELLQAALPKQAAGQHGGAAAEGEGAAAGVREGIP